MSQKFCWRITLQTEANKIMKSCDSFFFSFSFLFLFVFFLQILLNMHVYDSALYANLEDLNA